MGSACNSVLHAIPFCMQFCAHASCLLNCCYSYTSYLFAIPRARMSCPAMQSVQHFPRDSRGTPAAPSSRAPSSPNTGRSQLHFAAPFAAQPGPWGSFGTSSALWSRAPGNSSTSRRAPRSCQHNLAARHQLTKLRSCGRAAIGGPPP